MFRPEWDGQVCSLGYDVVDWIEAYCCHGPGDVQGKPVELDSEMAAFVVRAYELDPRTGRRKIDRAMLSRPKGRAKSELAGMIATAEAFGPVRFDGWDANGQPVGRPVVSPLIKCLATEESQAGNTFENAAFIVTDWGRDAHPDIYGGASGVRQYQSATAVYLPGGGEMRATTSGAASKDGGKESFVVPDETHLYVTSELRSMYATVARNCGKRKEAEPWMLQTTTAYEEGKNSVAEQVLTAWKAGKLPNSAHWLVDHREAIGAVDITNRQHTMEQLRYVYGAAASWMDLDRIYRTMLDPTECETPEVAARYFLNVPIPNQNLDGGVIPLAGYNAGRVDAPEDAPTAFGLDVTWDREWCSIGWGVGDYADIQEHGRGTAWVVEKCKALQARFPVPVFVMAKGPAAVLLDDLRDGGVIVEEVPGEEYARACGAIFDAIAEGRFKHSGHPALDAAVAGAQVSGGQAWVWDKKRGAVISPLVAVTLARHGAKNGPSVYENRELLVF